MSNIRSLDDYREKLLTKIINAGHPARAVRLLKTAIKTLEQHTVHAHLISRFIEKTSRQLELLQSEGEDSGLIELLDCCVGELDAMKKEKEETGKYVQA